MQNAVTEPILARQRVEAEPIGLLELSYALVPEKKRIPTWINQFELNNTLGDLVSKLDHFVIKHANAYSSAAVLSKALRILALSDFIASLTH